MLQVFFILLTAVGIAALGWTLYESTLITWNKESLISFLLWWEILLAFLAVYLADAVNLASTAMKGREKSIWDKICFCSISWILGIALFFGLFSTIRFFLFYHVATSLYVVLALGSILFCASHLACFYKVHAVTELKVSVATFAFMLHVSLWGVFGRECTFNEIDRMIGLFLLVGGVVGIIIVFPLLWLLVKREWKLILAEALGEIILELKHPDLEPNFDPKLKLKTGLIYLKSSPRKDVRRWINKSLKYPEKTWEIFSENLLKS